MALLLRVHLFVLVLSGSFASTSDVHGIDVERFFSLRASVMRSVPRFLQGLFKCNEYGVGRDPGER